MNDTDLKKLDAEIDALTKQYETIQARDKEGKKIPGMLERRLAIKAQRRALRQTRADALAQQPIHADKIEPELVKIDEQLTALGREGDALVRRKLTLIARRNDLTNARALTALPASPRKAHILAAAGIESAEKVPGFSIGGNTPAKK